MSPLLNLMGLSYFLVTFVVTILLALFFAQCARNKWKMTLVGLILFAVGFFIYFGPSRDNPENLSVPCKSLATICSDYASTSNAVVVVGLNPKSTEARTEAKPGIFDRCAMSFSAANRALSAFYPSRGDYDNTPKEGVSALCYWLFHLAAILYILVLAISFFCIEFRNSITLRMNGWLRRIKVRRVPISVFWNYSEEGEILAENLKEEDVVFVLPQNVLSWRDLQDDERAHRLVRKGALWVTDTAASALGLVRAEKHFFIGNDAHENVEKAQKLLEKLKVKPVSGRVKLYVRVWPEADDDAVFEWADRWNREFADEKDWKDVEVVMVREENIVSRKFLIDHPMLDCPGIEINTDKASVEGSFNVIVVGFGVQGERIAGDMICDAQFIDSSGKTVPISVDIVDRDAPTFGWFKANCRDACERYHMNFEQLDAGGEAFWKWIKERGIYNRIVICTQDDMVNLGLANDIANYYVQRFGTEPEVLKDTIFARVRRPSMNAVLAKCSKCYQTFGDTKETYSRNWLVDDKWDKGAKFINGVWAAKYDKRLPKGGRPLNWYIDNNKDGRRGEEYWRNTSTFNKESSRASFLHMRNLLRIVGFGVRSAEEVGDKDGLTEIPKEQIEEIKARLQDERRFDALAESEHMRWMAFHFVRGWMRWNPSHEELASLANEEKEQKKPGATGLEPNAKKKNKLHGNLIDFNDLEELDERFNEVNRANGWSPVNSREKDEAIVWGVEAVYDAGGFSVGRMEAGNE